eukprot:TRINITY_DN714_c0_g1_i1.p3 TRINITY_DN714_c0_g1~~TRINITY_DN714_c0_g1_i1.p3  ORF type:complete len:106 (+),score=19.18 TRINITY_DN714_c0_g1_i1:511-828(+)
MMEYSTTIEFLRLPLFLRRTLEVGVSTSSTRSSPGPPFSHIPPSPPPVSSPAVAGVQLLRLAAIGTDVESPYSALILSLIHISEPTRLLSISYAVFCLKKKKKKE